MGWRRRPRIGSSGRTAKYGHLVADEEPACAGKRWCGRVGRHLRLQPCVIDRVVNEDALARDLAERDVQTLLPRRHHVLRARRRGRAARLLTRPFVACCVQGPHVIVGPARIAAAHDVDGGADLGGAVAEERDRAIADRARRHPLATQQIEVHDVLSARANAAVQVKAILLELGLDAARAHERERVPRARTRFCALQAERFLPFI